VLDLLGRPEARQAMGARGRAWIEANWDTQVALGRMEAVFAGAVGGAT
jgi:hypothetical protein